MPLLPKDYVINLHKTSKYDVYIGRGSKWGNPFEIGKDGTRDEVCEKYEFYVKENKQLLEDVKELKGKILACYCYPEKCHGYFLSKLANS